MIFQVRTPSQGVGRILAQFCRHPLRNLGHLVTSWRVCLLSDSVMGLGETSQSRGLPPLSSQRKPVGHGCWSSISEDCEAAWALQETAL